MRKFSLKARLLIAMSLILTAAFVITSVVNYEVTRQSIRDELLNITLPLTGKNIYSDIHSEIMKPVLVASSMANDSFLADWAVDGEQDRHALIKYLLTIQQEYEFLVSFFVSNITDIYYYHGGILKTVGARDPDDVWFYSFLRTNREYRLNVDPSEAAQGKLTIFVNYRMEDSNGNLLGVTGVGMDMTEAARLLETAQTTYGRQVYLVDQDGMVQVHPNIRLAGKHSIANEEGLGPLADDILQPAESHRNFEFDRNGRHILLSTLYIPEFDWYLMVEQDESVLLRAARNNLYRTIAIGLVASLLIIMLSIVTMNHFQEQLDTLIKTDPLTGAANRRGVEEAFANMAYVARRRNESFSVLLLDLDGFKGINDTHGHIAGDRILRIAAEVILATIRPTDTLARWGGDEFLVLLEGNTASAVAVADRLHRALADASTPGKVTFSCGIALYKPGDSLDRITHLADEAMYIAKKAGGGCSHVIREDTE